MSKKEKIVSKKRTKKQFTSHRKFKKFGTGGVGNDYNGRIV